MYGINNSIMTEVEQSDEMEMHSLDQPLSTKDV